MSLRVRGRQNVEQQFLNSFTADNLREFAEDILEEDYGAILEERVVNWLERVQSAVIPQFTFSKIAPAHPVEDNLSGIDTMLDMDRNISQEVAQLRRGHRLCCGHCYITFTMVLTALLMVAIVGIGAWQIYEIGVFPIMPTIDNLLMFTERMIASGL